MKGDEGPRNMAEWWVEAIGLLAGALGIVAWVPQIREVWVHRRHEGISLPTFGLVSVALLLWLVYGLLVESPGHDHRQHRHDSGHSCCGDWCGSPSPLVTSFTP